MIGIYKIINKINGKIYIGQSIDIEERWKQHKYKTFNANGNAYNSAIHQAFRKYGVENFEYQVIELCSVEELDTKEIYWIEKLNTLAPNGYKILPGGQKCVLPQELFSVKDAEKKYVKIMTLVCVVLVCNSKAIFQKKNCIKYYQTIRVISQRLAPFME